MTDKANGEHHEWNAEDDEHTSLTPSKNSPEGNILATSRNVSATSLAGEHIGHDDGAGSPHDSYSDLPMTLSPPPSPQPDNPEERNKIDAIASHVISDNDGVVESSVPLSSSPNNNSGRPPRPHLGRTSSGDKPIPVISKPIHQRVTSTGDSSFMSALTEPEVDGGADGDETVPTPGKGMKHTLSFEQIQNFVKASQRGSDLLQQPDLTGSYKTASSDHSTGKKVFGKVNLQDVLDLNPMESEAENAIIKAVEKAHRRNHTSASLLPSIPDDAIGLFTNEHHTGLVFPLDEHAPSPTNVLRPRLDSRATAGSTRRPRILSGTSSRSVRSPDSRVAEDIDGPSTHASVATKQTAPVTTESKLFDVTQQFQDLQDTTDGDPHNIFSIPLPLQGHEAHNAQDALVQNANLLFRRSSVRVESTEGTDVESGESGDGHDTPQAQNLSGKKTGGFFGFRNKKKEKVDESSPELTVDTGGDSDGKTKKGKKGLRKLKQSVKMVKVVKEKTVNAGRAVKSDFDYMRDYLRPKQKSVRIIAYNTIRYVFLPALAVSVALFYAGNPKLCIDDNKSDEVKTKSKCASFSWFFIFLFIRQGVTLAFAKIWEVLIIDLLSIRSRRMVRLIGPALTLLVVQSKGWPFVLLVWSLMDFVVLYGSGKFAKHWLFWQDVIPWFNDENPAGDVLENDFYRGILTSAVIVGASVSIKRLWMGIYLGKRTYTNYGKELAKVMNDMLLISSVAAVAHEFESNAENALEFTGMSSKPRGDLFGWDDLGNSEADLEEEKTSVSSGHDQAKRSPGHTPPRKLRSPSNASEGNVTRRSGDSKRSPRRDGDVQAPLSPLQGGPSLGPSVGPGKSFEEAPTLHKHSIDQSQKIKVMQLLGPWDEPKRPKEKFNNVTIQSILQFRQALQFMDDAYPFSLFFGLADKRETCIESAQAVYGSLQLRTPDEPLLPFTSIAFAASESDEEVQQRKLKRLHKLFLPNKDGFLTPLDFVKSVDNVYKNLRMLRASIANSAQIDEAFESIFNVVFSVILGCIVLSALGFDPLSMFLALSSIILSFAFMIGSASAKYFEGVLLILVRRPYDIGDRVNVSSPDSVSGGDGSPAWFVENVDLFSTTVRYATTNEVATYSNGSLANMRIINARRSPSAIRYVRMKFGIDVPYAKVEVFKTTVESFVKQRPREWVALTAFRANRVEADLGFIEYVIVCQHVEGWQNMGPILNSAAELQQYCLEVSKQLGMRYTAPALPVQLDLARADMFSQMMNSGNGSRAGESNKGKNTDSPVPLSMGRP